MKNCPKCFYQCHDTNVYCNNCGAKFESDFPASEVPYPTAEPDSNMQQQWNPYLEQVLVKEKKDRRIMAAILAIVLGSLGIHKFFLKKYIQGIFYILFVWTGIPAAISVMEGIRYLCLSDEHFEIIYGNK